MTVSLLLATDLNRIDYIDFLLNMLAEDGFNGEVIFGVYNGYDKLDRLKKLVSDLSIKNKILIQEMKCPFGKSLAEIALHAREKYTLWTPDDDFLNWSAVKDCINVLDANPQYASAQGAMLREGVRKVTKEIVLSPVFLRELRDQDIVLRLHNLLTGYCHCFFSVARTENTREFYQKIVPFDGQYDFIQYLLSILYAESGPSIMVNNIMWVRATDITSSSITYMEKKDPNHPPYNIIHPSFSQRFNAFQEAVKSLAREHRPITENDHNLLDEGFVDLVRWMLCYQLPLQAQHKRARYNEICESLKQSPKCNSFINKTLNELKNRNNKVVTS